MIKQKRHLAIFRIFRTFLNFYRFLLLKKMRLLVGIFKHCVLGLRGQNSLDHHYVKHPVFYCITAICPPTPTTIVVLQPKPLAQSRLAFRRLLVQQHEFKLRLLEMSNVINETEARGAAHCELYEGAVQPQQNICNQIPFKIQDSRNLSPSYPKAA